MIGRTLGHYRIDSQVGKGGMGVVYRARDLRLERDVALKVLPAGLLADESARKRFRKEALALSQLNHPNIATVHDFDTEEGVDFLVLEYIAGASLDERLAAGPLVEKELLGLASQLASGLAAAHEQGIVHRDLKPANLRVTPDGRLKILDFGLAALVRPQGDAAASTVSLIEGPTVAGTVPYMAPEQLRGEKADARADLHATGAVLYEMATGRRAFPQAGGTQMIAAILQEMPTTPATLNPRVSPALEGIILKCLDKEPERRYQTARELRVDLERLSAPAPVTASAPRARRRPWLLPAVAVALAALLALAGFALYWAGRNPRTKQPAGEPASIAVLPFVDMSENKDQEFFCDGITEEIITALAKLEGLRVVARTSAFEFKGKGQDIRKVGAQLNVATVLEGSVRRAGGALCRYDLDGAELWTREFSTSDAAWARGVAVDASGVYVVGRYGTDDLSFSAAPPGSGAFLAKFEKTAAVVTDSRPRIFPDCVVNAASYVGGGVAPGEIVTLFGSSMGPSELVRLRLTDDRRLATTLADTRILFNGVPAPLLYVSDKQSSAIVPYAVADRTSVEVQVEYRGVQSDPVTVPVLRSRPGIFSQDGTGHGLGAILNEDGSLNSPSNPAARGSIISIFGTGGGETAPDVVDGQLVSGNLPRTSVPVSVVFDVGLDDEFGNGPKLGEVLYAGGSPGSVAGLLQVNVRVPADAMAGDRAPLALIIGSHWTVFQVTISLR